MEESPRNCEDSWIRAPVIEEVVDNGSNRGDKGKLHKNAAEYLNSGGTAYTVEDIMAWREEYIKAYDSFRKYAEEFAGMRGDIETAADDKEVAEFLREMNNENEE